MKKWFKPIGIILSIILVILLIASFFPTKSLLVLGSFLDSSNNNALGIDKKINSEPVNIAIMGFTGAGNNGAYLTDTLMVAHIDPIQHKLTLISIPRDLLVSSNGTNSLKVNGVFWAANEKNPSIFENPNFSTVKQELESITGLPIHYATIFDVETVRSIVNGLGGLNVYISEKVSDPNLADSTGTGGYFNLEPGWRYLDGNMVVSLVRSRYANDGDFFRIKHQQQILLALGAKLKDLNFLTDGSKLLQIKKGINGHFATDLNNNQLFTLASIMANIPQANWQFSAISFEEPNPLLVSTTIATNTGYSYVLIPKAGTGNYSDIQSYIAKLIN